MEIVDTHCHAVPLWFEPVETLMDQMNRNGVQKAVLIQVRGVYDNTYLVECLRRFSGRLAGVAMVDTTKPDAPAILAELIGQGVQGVRLTPDERSVGPDSLAIWWKAAELGIPVSCGGGLQSFADPEFEAIIKQFPNLKVIIEHLGRGGDDDSPSRDTYQKVLALSQYPNTYMKVPGLGEFCQRPMPFVQPFPFSEIPPVIEMALDAFGPQRLMWGSDFPPSASREGYRNALNWPMENVKFKSEADKEWVFGKTAMSIWNFGE